MVEDATCWICLGSGDESPPLGTAEDAHDWVHPCRCSLKAHRRCLLEWVANTNLEYKNEVLNELNTNGLNIGFESVNILDSYSSLHRASTAFHPFSWLNFRAQDRPQNEWTGFDPSSIRRAFPSGEEEEVIMRVTNAMSAGARERKIDSNGHSRKFVINTVCPQCNAPILLKTNRGIMLLLSSTCSRFIDWAVKGITKATLVGTVGGSILFSCAGLFLSWGLKVLTTLAPESTLLKLLDLSNCSSINHAFHGDSIGFRQVLLLSSTPIYLLSLRFDNTFTSWVRWIYPLAFLRPKENLNTSVKRFMLFQYPLGLLHEILFKLLLNPIYFRWVHRVKPYFVCDQMTIDQLRIFEAEQSYIETRKELSLSNNNSESIMSKIKSLFFSKGDDHINESIHTRRLLMTLKFDYSQALLETSMWEKVASTVYWPLSGKYFNHFVLMRFSAFQELLSQHASTSDDVIYLGNLLGCCVTVVLKDLINLLITWRRVRQLESLEVLEYMSPEWEYIINSKMGQVLNGLSSLGEDDQSEIILEEHAERLLGRVYHDQWIKISYSIPTVHGRVNYLRYLVMKQNIERSLEYQKGQQK